MGSNGKTAEWKLTKDCKMAGIKGITFAFATENTQYIYIFYFLFYLFIYLFIFAVIRT